MDRVVDVVKSTLIPLLELHVMMRFQCDKSHYKTIEVEMLRCRQACHSLAQSVLVRKELVKPSRRRGLLDDDRMLQCWDTFAVPECAGSFTQAELQDPLELQ
ncbi:hypothetical protein R1flu_020970 [Riccia fluitans]|uniref:Uncharacterized protein n=1 Tax=Riccia fluitans TaxID=41844 RepID=A0ABD1ZNI2_9MARC